jgi:hypothetical protein
MLTIELEPELEDSLTAEAEKEHCTVNDIIKKLIYSHFKEKQEPKLLIDIIKDLPEFPSFKDKDPLELQREWRNEWN